MPRQREFDTEDVLRRAMEVFWRQGYAGTSMADLYAATGLKPGSLYGAFRDKEHLFRAAFEAYARHFRATLPEGLRGLAAIEAWLRLQAELAAGDPERRGCLIVNTMMERNAHAPATRALADDRLREIRRFFRENLEHAAGAGELPATLDRDRWADSLLGTVVSIMGLGRAGADRAVITNVAEAAVEAVRGMA